MLHLIPVVKNYAWGSSKNDCLVKEIFLKNIQNNNPEKNNEQENIKKEKNWAEIWIGTHQSGMTHLLNGETLFNHLKCDLPFIFKILSIEKCLSIQMHPDSEWAKKLHFQDPKNYPDPYPKPEMAIAIDYLDSFSGYCNFEELSMNLSKYPNFYSILQKQHFFSINFSAKNQSENIKNLIEYFFSLNIENLKQNLDVLFSDINLIDKKCFRDETIMKLFDQFGYDVGILMSLLLNIVRLKPFEYIAIGPFIPHAYISGNVIECMPPSDNVIRVGLTPKFKDIDNFMLMYQYIESNDNKKMARTKIYADKSLRIREFPHDLGNYFKILMFQNIHKEEDLIDLNEYRVIVEEKGIFFNFEESPIEINGLVVRQHEFCLVVEGEMKIKSSQKVNAIFCSRSVNLEKA